MKIVRTGFADVVSAPRRSHEAPVSLSVMTTYSCQLACFYCQVRQSPVSITHEVLRESIDFLLRSKAKNIELKFFGGEPLLRPDLIREGAAYCEKHLGKDRSCRYMLVTNGILLDGENLRWLKRLGFQIMLSVDGRKSAHTAQRSAAGGEDFHARIIKNAVALAKSEIPYMVNVVTTPRRAGLLFGELDYLAMQGITSLQAAYDVSSCWPQSALEKFMTCCARFSSAAQRGKYGEPVPVLRNFVNDAEPVSLKTDLIADCDGKIYRDGAMFLEKRLPLARKVFYLGEARLLALPEAVAVSPKEHLRLWLSACKTPGDRRMFLSTLSAGLRLRRFYSTHSPLP